MKTLKNILASFLAVLLVVAIIPIATTADDMTTPEADSGWVAISTPAEFLAISATGNYYLANDIDFTDYNGIGTGTYKAQYLVSTFSGTLDGRGHTVKGFGIDVTTTATTNCGMFGTTGATATATIVNLILGTGEAPITAAISAGHAVNFGFISGCSAGGADLATVFDHVTVYGQCEIDGTADQLIRTGGLLGFGYDISITQSSFIGSIEITGTCSILSNGGLAAEIDSYSNRGKTAVIKNCNINGVLNTNCSEGVIYMGGVIGYSKQQSLLVDSCTTAGAYTASGASDCAVGGVLGILSTNEYAALFVASDCSNTATLESQQDKGIVYGCIDTNAANVTRTYIRNCNGQNTPSRDIGNTDGVNASDVYVWEIDDASDFAKIGAEENGYTYSRTGFYRLKNDIDMSEIGEKTTPVVSGGFGGVFDGNGKAIKNLSMNTSSGDNCGLFDILAGTGTGSCVIMNLDIGTATTHASFSGAVSKYVGAIAAQAGVNNFAVTISSVNVYADINANYSSNSGAAFSGFVGYAMKVGLYDCNMFGSIISTTNKAHRTHAGGFIGWINSGNMKDNILYNCNNFADVRFTCTGVRRIMIGGLIGCTAGVEIFLNCNNFGDIANNSSATTNNDSAIDAGGFVGCKYAIGSILGCANFGNVSSAGSSSNNIVCASSIAADGNAISVALADFEQFGVITGNAPNKVTFSKYNCKVGTAVEMVTGASVRLSGRTGLRFQANVSTDALAQLQKISGMMISYGTLISPSQFITEAGGFTHAKLDAYSTVGNGFTDSKAYVDVTATDWFLGEEGVIAGSIVNLSDTVYETAFSGVGYIALKIGNEVVYRLYASTPQSRTIKAVAQSALDDVLYEKSGTLYEKNGENYTVYTGDDAATYTTNVGAEGDYIIMSCYTAEERTLLTGFTGAGA